MVLADLHAACAPLHVVVLHRYAGLRITGGVSVPVGPVAEPYVLRVFRGRILTASSLLEEVPLET